LPDFAGALILELNDSHRQGTAGAYRSTLNSLTAFAGNERLLLLEDITSPLLCAFQSYLLDRGLCHNSIASYMRGLRAMLNKATGRKLMLPTFENPFADVHTGVYQTEKRALTEDDMRRLTNLRSQEAIPTATYQALLFFLFEFHSCGMSFIDLVFLRKNDLSGNHIRYFRKKTKRQVPLKITAAMQEILDYFRPLTADSPYVFPIIKPALGNERKQYETALRLQNRRLKKLASLAGIDKNISTHVARHSWATIAKKKNLSIALISECLGHQDEKTTAIYLDSFDSKVKDDACEQISALIANPRSLTNDRVSKNKNETFTDYQLYRRRKVTAQKSPLLYKKRTPD
jgi:site-specific recombinase XerD